jgi:hypothetical protein
MKRLESCAGAVIIAFERTHVSEGVDRGRPVPENALRDRALTTVWNQIEAAMAYTLGRPLLVIVEEGLVSEGLLGARNDWSVQWLPLDPARLETAEFLGSVGDWKRSVLALSEQRNKVESSKLEPDITGKTVGQIVGELRPGQFRALVAGTADALAAIATTAFSLGAKLG